MTLKSWLQIPLDSHFSLANIPFGIISNLKHKTPRPAIAIGEYALDLDIFSDYDGFSRLDPMKPHLAVFQQPTLNDFAALGRPIHRQVRQYLQEVLSEDTKFPGLLKDHEELRHLCLLPLQDVKLHLPFRIGDYTDFYAGKNHAQNCGALFKNAADALPPNYVHQPIGYHGRASSVVVSGTPIHRPRGQIMPSAMAKKPMFSESKRLDFELEFGAFICRENAMGEAVPIERAEESIFGFVLLNDWSARDIQAWEMAPLGPFNSKNFGTSVSGWVVLADAMAPFKTKGIQNHTQVLPYLQEPNAENVYDLNLQVDFSTKSSPSETVTLTNASNLLFSFPQMIAQHTASGCPFRVGDLIASGTISGPSPGVEARMAGSLLELTMNGAEKIGFANGEERTFLEDGDTIRMTGRAGKEGGLVGFGECMGRIEGAKSV